MEEPEAQESTLLQQRLVHVYRVPPRVSSEPYSCASWLVSDEIWAGRLHVVERGAECVVRLVSSADTPGRDGRPDELFAECPIAPGERSVAVEPVSDSSRYFVLRLRQRGDAGATRQAFVGLGFDARESAFDFMASLNDHERHQRARAEAAERGAAASSPTDYSLSAPITLNAGFAKRASPPAAPRATAAIAPVAIAPPPAAPVVASPAARQPARPPGGAAPLPSDWESF